MACTEGRLRALAVARKLRCRRAPEGRALLAHAEGGPVKPTIAEKRRRFAELHRAPGAFVMPNPFDAGSAKYLASLGFPALATTSAGMAFAAGRPDGGVTRAYALAHIAELAAAVACALTS